MAETIMQHGSRLPYIVSFISRSCGLRVTHVHAALEGLQQRAHDYPIDVVLRYWAQQTTPHSLLLEEYEWLSSRRKVDYEARGRWLSECLLLASASPAIYLLVRLRGQVAGWAYVVEDELDTIAIGLSLLLDAPELDDLLVVDEEQRNVLIIGQRTSAEEPYDPYFTAHVVFDARRELERMVERELAARASGPQAQAHFQSVRQWLENLRISILGQVPAAEQLTHSQPFHEELLADFHALPELHVPRDLPEDELRAFIDELFADIAHSQVVCIYVDVLASGQWWEITSREPLFRPSTLFENDRDGGDRDLISADLRHAFGWWVWDEHISFYRYPVDLLLERRASKERLLGLLVELSPHPIRADALCESSVCFEDIYLPRWRTSTSTVEASREHRAKWVARQLRTFWQLYTTSSEEDSRMALSVGRRGLIPWHAVGRGHEDWVWLADLWDAIDHAPLSVRPVSCHLVLGIRKVEGMLEAYIYRGGSTASSGSCT